MKIVVTVAALNLQDGGPPRTVPGLCRALARAGAEVELITISEGQENTPSANGFVRTILSTQTDRYHPSPWKPDFCKALGRAIKEVNAILYDVGLWLPSNHFVARFADRTGIPLIISPRGMLSPQALQVARWKKKLAWHLYQRRDLNAARGFHATSEAEAEDLRSLGLKQPIAVIPNGVELTSPDRKLTPSSNLTILFLSRIHPIKGLLDLVEAWSKVRTPKWRVVIAGPDENNHAAQVKRRLVELDIVDDFTFVGSVDDEQKTRLLAAADLFVLPSHSESFGLVVAEALAAGLPVITTTATPWQSIQSFEAGWWIPPEVEPLAKALSDATSRSVGELHAIGARGRELVAHNYSWESAAAKMLEFFNWILQPGKRPEFVG